MGELLALAMNSNRSNRLSNTSAGATRAQTWWQTVRIREANGVRLQLVFRDGDIGEMPPPGKTYS